MADIKHAIGIVTSIAMGGATILVSCILENRCLRREDKRIKEDRARTEKEKNEYSIGRYVAGPYSVP